jgi:inner membrane protein
LGWLVNKLEKKSNLGWKLWAKLFFFGLITHPLLDAFTTWGTQIFWPLDISVAFNSIFVIDPLYTLPFLIFTVLSMFYKRESRTRAKLNRVGLLISSAYLLVTVGLKFIVTHKFEEALQKQNITYSQISTRPSPMNTILWNANVETSDSYFIGDYSFFDTQPIRFETYPKNRETSRKLMEYHNVKRLIDISENWFFLEQKNNHWYFNDLRFGLLPKKEGTPVFVFSYELKKIDGKIIATEVSKTNTDAKFMITTLWDRIKGN